MKQKWRGTRSIEKICPNCNKPFKTFKSVDSKTCSKGCADAYRHKLFYLRAKKICQKCGREFLPKHNKATKGLFCSHGCFGKAQSKPFIFRNGYKYLHLPNHPNATKQGYFAEHRYIMEQKLKRYLNKSEQIHHIDRNKTNNNPKNLQCYVSPGQHIKSNHLTPFRDKGKWASISKS